MKFYYLNRFFDLVLNEIKEKKFIQNASVFMSELDAIFIDAKNELNNISDNELIEKLVSVFTNRFHMSKYNLQTHGTISRSSDNDYKPEIIFLQDSAPFVDDYQILTFDLPINIQQLKELLNKWRSLYDGQRADLKLCEFVRFDHIDLQDEKPRIKNKRFGYGHGDEKYIDAIVQYCVIKTQKLLDGRETNNYTQLRDSKGNRKNPLSAKEIAYYIYYMVKDNQTITQFDFPSQKGYEEIIYRLNCSQHYKNVQTDYNLIQYESERLKRGRSKFISKIFTLLPESAKKKAKIELDKAVLNE